VGKLLEACWSWCLILFPTEGIVRKKADVIVLSDKGNDLLKYQLLNNGQFKYVDNTRVLTGFGKEIEYMENLVRQGKYQWDEGTGVYKYTGN
jgi:hypothetical protein